MSSKRRKEEIEVEVEVHAEGLRSWKWMKSTLKTLRINCLLIAKKGAAWYYEAIFLGIALEMLGKKG